MVQKEFLKLYSTLKFKAFNTMYLMFCKAITISEIAATKVRISIMVSVSGRDPLGLQINSI